MKNIIAFDLGGSGGKIFLGRFNGETIDLEVLHRFSHAAVPMGVGLYWDVVRIYQEMLIGIKKAIKVTNDDIASFGVDSYCNDYCIMSPYGEILSQMHSYRDDRTIRHEKELYSIMSKKELYMALGNQYAPFNTLMELGAFIIEGNAHVLKNNHILWLPDLLIFLLSGKEYTEYTLASVSQMYDMNKLCWRKDILDAYGIPDNIFKPLVFPGTINAEVNETMKKDLGTKGFPIATVCEHDTGSAFLSSIANEPHVIISCGTWAIAGTELPAPFINEEGYRYNIANEGSMEGHHRLLRNTMGTWILQEIKADLLKQGTDMSFPEMEAEALKSKPFKYAIDVDDNIFYAPGKMCSRIREYCTSHYGNAPETIGEIIRCVYESLAFKYRFSMEKLSNVCSQEFMSVNIIGGGSQSDLMCRFTADACNLPVKAGPVEATALGNMITQLVALGEIKSIEEGRRIIAASSEIKEYTPSDAELWDAEYKKFLKKYNL